MISGTAFQTSPHAMSPLVTVIIPTYNRPHFLVQTIRFLQRYSPHLPIIISDGSNEENASRNARCRELGQNITYFHFPLQPPEDIWNNFWRRILHALDLVRTPYAAVCADDELLIAENAVHSAEFLEGNPQYVACHGYYLQFKYAQDTIQIPNIEYHGASIDADEINGRVLQLFSRYEAPFYAVFRTTSMRHLFERCREPEPPLWPEIYHSTAAVIAGKIHRTNTIYCLRNIGTPSHHSLVSSFLDFGQWVAADLDGFLAHYVTYRARALEWAASVGDPTTLRRALDMAFITYIGSEFDPSYWIDRCCETVKDEAEREKLRRRLDQNVSRVTRHAAFPSIRSAGIDLMRALLRQEQLSKLLQSRGGRLRAAIERRRWTRLTPRAGNLDGHNAPLDRYYRVDVRTNLIKRFPPEQWNYLIGIEKPN